jgi:hypothetical protein
MSLEGSTNRIRRIAKADITNMRSHRRRIPRHDHRIQIRRNREHNCDSPGAELTLWQSEALATLAEDEEVEGEREVEGGGWVDCYVDD